jgi:hypothetical protein
MAGIRSGKVDAVEGGVQVSLLAHLPRGGMLGRTPWWEWDEVTPGCGCYPAVDCVEIPCLL